MDFRNKFSNHFIVALISFLLALVFYLFGINLIRATAGVAFILLFLTLIIGPIMRLFRPAMQGLPWDLPWSWRGEIGIWFAILSIVHVSLIFSGKQWDIIGYIVAIRIGDLVGLAALFLSIVLAVTSFGKVINYLGVTSWRWLHSFAYVVFYLVAAHTISHAFLRPGSSPDWLNWTYLVLIFIVIVLQIAAFAKTVISYRRSLKPKDNQVSDSVAA